MTRKCVVILENQRFYLFLSAGGQGMLVIV